MILVFGSILLITSVGLLSVFVSIEFLILGVYFSLLLGYVSFGYGYLVWGLVLVVLSSLISFVVLGNIMTSSSVYIFLILDF